MFGSDYGVMGATGYKSGVGGCHCRRTSAFSGSGAMMGLEYKTAGSDSWCTCGCYTSYPSGGGQSGVSTYCGSSAKCCAAGGPGGSGIVKITFS